MFSFYSTVATLTNNYNRLFLLDIMNSKPRLAWELYLKMETSAESFNIVQMIANDCYKVFHSIKKKILISSLLHPRPVTTFTQQKHLMSWNVSIPLLNTGRASEEHA